MGSVAVALCERGFKVTGSDENVFPPMSIFLGKKGIALKEGYRAENIPPDADVVVIGNAIKRGNPEVETVLSRKLLYLSLPEVLKNYFLRGRHNLVVTGTHGKTTTTALLAWIMEKGGCKPGYFIGGLPKNFGQGARLNDSKYFVIEGDEYDSAFFDKRSKFIHSLPELVIVNNIEFDHADIFNNLDEIKLSFRRLLNIVPQNGMVVLNGDDANCVDVAKDCLAQLIEVGFSKNCAQRIREVAYSSSGSRFKLGEETFEIPLIGEFNVRNAAMAATVARFYDVPKTKVDNAFKRFSGIARRQEVRGEARGVKVIDDFGHHPTAIAHDAGASSSLSRPPHLGSFRATLEHDTAGGFSTATFRRIESGGRRFYFPSRQAGANPGEREVKSRGSCKYDSGKRPSGVLRGERRCHYQSNRANAQSERHRRCFQQRRIRSNSREAIGETTRLKGYNSDAWKRGVTHF